MSNLYPHTAHVHDSTRDISWIWAAFGSLLLFLWAHHSGFFNPYIINDDTRQQLFWMQRWLEPELYPPDLLNEYARLYVPWGVQGLYYLASFLIAPLIFSKILTGILYVFTGTLVYLTGKRVNGSSLGLTTVSVYWFMPFFLHAMSGGLARAFAGPLLMLFLFGWICASRRIVAAALLLQAVFIPYIFILCGGASALGWLAWRIKVTDRPPFLSRTGDFAIAATACALLLAWKWQMGDGFGPLPSLADMVGKPEFSSDGRFHIVPVPSILHELFVRPWEFIAPFRDQNDIAGIIGVILIVPAAIYGGMRFNWRQWKRHIVPIACLALSSVALYVTARILLFKLFLPSRYLEYSVNVGYCLLLGSCLHGLIFNRSTVSRTTASICLTLVFLLGCYRNTDIGLYDYSANKTLYTAIQEHTPVNAVIAGHPYLMDNVLIFGKRNVFASYELAHPWNLGYWKRLQPRLDALFTAYYAGDLSTVVAFCRDNAIDYIVVDKRHFKKEFLNDRPFFAPFDDRIRTTAAHTHQFALLSPSVCTTRINDTICLIDATTLSTDKPKE